MEIRSKSRILNSFQVFELKCRHGGRQIKEAQQLQTTLELPDVDGASHNKCSLLTKAAYQAPSMCRRWLRCARQLSSTERGVNAFQAAETEHARSYGTAASAAGNFCCLKLLRL